MKMWVLAGLFSVATVPAAFAVESTTECQVDDTRRVVEQRIEAPPAPAAPTIARPTVAQRDATLAETPRLETRRRSGKRIPDAELIGPRGAL